MRVNSDDRPIEALRSSLQRLILATTGVVGKRPFLGLRSDARKRVERVEGYRRRQHPFQGGGAHAPGVPFGYALTPKGLEDADKKERQAQCSDVSADG